MHQPKADLVLPRIARMNTDNTGLSSLVAVQFCAAKHKRMTAISLRFRIGAYLC
jgi:hypothetical protein